MTPRARRKFFAIPFMGKAGSNHGAYLPHRTPRKTYTSRITLFLSREWMIDRRPIPTKEKNWKSSGGNGRGGTNGSLRDREKPVSDLHTRFFPRIVCCAERDQPPVYTRFMTRFICTM